MSTMVRKQIYIRAGQERMLKREAKRQGVSEAEVIRRAIDAAVTHPPRGGDDPTAFARFRAFAEQLMAKGPLPGKRDWSRDELYEERVGRYAKRVSG
jgi:hypothetical protein